MSLSLTTLHPRFGMRVEGLDLSNIDDATFETVRNLFEQHSALLFPGQSLSDADHMALAERFGPIEDRHADERPKGAAFKVPEVTNIREDGTTSGEMDLQTLNLKSNMLWHSDSTFMPNPALTNILIARIVTETGGQTELASTRAAWADMPQAMKETVRDLGFWHHYANSRAQISPELASLPMFHKWPAQLWRAVWPNPVTGEEALYIASHAYAVEGLDPQEGAALLADLMGFVTRPDYVYPHRWTPGDILIWDQRAVLHRATPWNYDEPRKLSSICVTATEKDGLDSIRMGKARAPELTCA